MIPKSGYRFSEKIMRQQNAHSCPAPPFAYKNPIKIRRAPYKGRWQRARKTPNFAAASKTCGCRMADMRCTMLSLQRARLIVRTRCRQPVCDSSQVAYRCAASCSPLEGDCRHRADMTTPGFAPGVFFRRVGKAARNAACPRLFGDISAWARALRALSPPYILTPRRGARRRSDRPACRSIPACGRT